MTIHDQIDRLDVELFQTIAGQTSLDDRRSLLALQSACRQWKQEPYCVLEIGSYEGGSLQGYVADPACERIISIDPRPAIVRDERGSTWDYSQVSAEGMVGRLEAVPGANTRKIRVLTTGVEGLMGADLDGRPDICFVDGEHTDEAVLRDARFCLAATGQHGVIAFHDANIVYRALRAFLDGLEGEGRPFRAYNLPSVVFVVELGSCRLSDVEPLASWRTQNYKGYLDSLLANDPHRELARRYESLLQHPVLGLARRLGLVAAAKKLTGISS